MTKPEKYTYTHQILKLCGKIDRFCSKQIRKGFQPEPLAQVLQGAIDSLEWLKHNPSALGFLRANQTWTIRKLREARKGEK
jgi:hypothetical protein